MNGFFEHIRDAADIRELPVPGVPLLELAGDKRVLIEHHKGISEYTRSCIGVYVDYGILSISGQKLELAKMTRELLVICGKIESIHLDRRTGA